MTLERRAWNIARATTILLVLVSMRVVYWQMVRGNDLQPVAVNLVQAAGEYTKVEGESSADTRRVVEFLTGVSTIQELQSLPAPVIQRTMNFLQMIRRGTIYDRNGRVLAQDLPSADGEIIRFYSEPSLAHAIGYVSGLRTGVTGLELRYNNSLLGLDRPDAQIEHMLNKPITGSDLLLTIDSYIQRAAESALGGRTGSILVLDAANGAVLAMVSEPHFDPNRVLDESYVTELTNGCDAPQRCQAPFLNRAAQALYPPGSTWKTVTLIAALDSGQVTPDTIFDFGKPIQGENGAYYVYQVDGSSIIDPNHSEAQLNLEMSYNKSANAAFARIGDEMPPDILINYAGRFGFGPPENAALAPTDIEYIPSQLAQDPASLYSSSWLRAVTAIGQGELLATPLNIAVLVLSVVNDGDLPVPYLVQAVKEPDGSVKENLPNRHILEGLMKPITAQQVREMMISVVEHGSGQKALLPGLIVGGKTGTAQVGGNLAPHSWFAGFVQNGTRGVVVVVLIENGGEGSQTAAPVFAQVAQAAIDHLGEPVGEIVPTPVLMPTAVIETPQAPGVPAATSTPTSAEGIIPLSPTQQPTDFPVPSPTPTVSLAPVSGGIPPPDLPRDPTKNDITADNPSCADLKDMPQATGEFIWPTPFQALSGGDFRTGHPGFDLSAPPGSAVSAADTGLVIFAGWSGLGYGNVILIDHGNGYQTLYAHLSQVSTYCGAKVEKGQLVGLSGDTGNSTGPHLHFEVRVPGGYLDPLKVLPLP